MRPGRCSKFRVAVKTGHMHRLKSVGSKTFLVVGFGGRAPLPFAWPGGCASAVFACRRRVIELRAQISTFAIQARSPSSAL